MQAPTASVCTGRGEINWSKELKPQKPCTTCVCVTDEQKGAPLLHWASAAGRGMEEAAPEKAEVACPADCLTFVPSSLNRAHLLRIHVRQMLRKEEQSLLVYKSLNYSEIPHPSRH